MNLEQLLAMPLGESQHVGVDTSVLRVPGGWVYITRYMGYEGGGAASVFVPEPKVVEYEER